MFSIRSRSGHFAVKLRDGRVLVGAGLECGVTDPAMSTALFDPRSGSWNPGPPLRVDRYGPTAHLLRDGRVLVAGGVDRNSATSTEIYDPVANAWSAGPPLPGPLFWVRGISLPDGSVVVLGEWNDLTFADILDPAATTWTTVPLPEPTTSFQVMAALPDGTILIAGGNESMPSGRPWPRSKHAWALDPDTKSVTALPDLPVALVFQKAATLRDGRILLAMPAMIYEPPDAFFYHPKSRTWSVAGQATVPFNHGTLTALPDGRALLAGGWEPYPSPDYHWDTRGRVLSLRFDDAWWELPAMLVHRVRHTATLLDDGRVLFVGGAENSECSDPGAEIYSPMKDSASPAALSRSAPAYLPPRGGVPAP